jgi:CRISPR system Cascade subunit CasA
MNLLTEPAIRVHTADGAQPLSLPNLLEALGEDRVESFPGLQRHQEEAFHVFLCYLAGAALARSPRADPVQPAAFWTEALRRLAGRDDDSAWTLVVADPTRPALLQPPLAAPYEFAAEFRTERGTPDAIDVLLTAKNHDIKAARAVAPQPDEWLYALVSLQTTAGYVLKHQGIARMNSGFGSRAYVSLVYGESPGEHWLRDTRKLLAVRPALLQSPWPYRADGVVLTWLRPWNRKTSLAVAELDPFFIEVARGVRLLRRNGRIVARTATEQAPRIDAKTYHGVLGDPWTPVNRNDPKKGESALTVGPSGFTPELLRNLIFEDGFALAPMQRPDRDSGDRPVRFTAAVLVRGQGITDGFRNAVVPVPAALAPRLFQPGPDRERLARLSKAALADAADLRNRALKPAVLALLQAGVERIDFDKRETAGWWRHSAQHYAAAWGAAFFPWLWQTADAGTDAEALTRWRHRLHALGLASLAEALARSPGREGRRFRAQVRAEGFFYRNLHRIFPELKTIANPGDNRDVHHSPSHAA